MNTSPEVRKQQITTVAKWGIGIGAAAVVAPVMFLAIKGIAGLAIAAVMGLALVNFAPVLAMKFANWKLKGMKHEARINPIETRQNIALQAREHIKQAQQELTAFAAEVRNFADEVRELKRDQPDDAQEFQEQLDALTRLHEHKKVRLQDAIQKAAEFEAATARAERKWKVAQSAIRMQKLTGEQENSEMDKLLAAESLNSVQSAMNQALAELDSAIALKAPIKD